MLDYARTKLMATEKEDDDFSVSFLFYDFLGYTTVHGAGRIVASRHWIKTLFWITLILGTRGVLTWQIHILYKLYEERPLTTHVAIQHDTVRVLYIHFVCSHLCPTTSYQTYYLFH